MDHQAIQPALRAQAHRTAAADAAIDVQGVDKIFGSRWNPARQVHALRSINMYVRRGSIFGLLGPNGAGKSTLVKILMTVVKPTRCRGTMLDRPIGDKAVLARVGYLPEHHRFPDYLTARQILDHFAALSFIDRSTRKKRVPQLLETVGIARWADVRVKNFSKGMRQRLGVANALVNDPDLVMLDEPTDGVDPVGRRDIRNILLALKQQGKTVFLNSHLLSELEMVCDTVAILVQGRVSAQGTIDQLTDYSKRYEIELVPEPDAAPSLLAPNPNPNPANFNRLADALRAAGVQIAHTHTPHGADLSQHHPPAANSRKSSGLLPDRFSVNLGKPIPVSFDGDVIQLAANDPRVVQPILDALRAHGFVIRSLRPVRATLEDLFMRAVTDPATGTTLAPGAAPNQPSPPPNHQPLSDVAKENDS